MNKLEKFKFKSINENTLGYFSKTTDSSLIEASIYSGFDFVIIDMEHGPIQTEMLKHHLMATSRSELISIVRVDSFDSRLIGKVLDLGADGIQIPSVTSVEQVLEVIKLSKFYPIGERGVCRFVRSAEYSNQDRNVYFKKSNESIIVIQLEGKEGIDNFDDIVQIQGVDIIFVGPYDLSQSLGIPGQIEHPIIIEKITELQLKAKAKGIALGTFCDTPHMLKHWRNLNLGYLAYSVDIAIFMEKLKEINSLRIKKDL